MPWWLAVPWLLFWLAGAMLVLCAWLVLVLLAAVFGAIGSWAQGRQAKETR